MIRLQLPVYYHSTALTSAPEKISSKYNHMLQMSTNATIAYDWTRNPFGKVKKVCSIVQLQNSQGDEDSKLLGVDLMPSCEMERTHLIACEVGSEK